VKIALRRVLTSAKVLQVRACSTARSISFNEACPSCTQLNKASPICSMSSVGSSSNGLWVSMPLNQRQLRASSHVNCVCGDIIWQDIGGIQVKCAAFQSAVMLLAVEAISCGATLGKRRDLALIGRDASPLPQKSRRN
jgi:hypothetical protein